LRDRGFGALALAMLAKSKQPIDANEGRPEFNGYRVVFVPFSGGHPNGKAEDVVTDFLTRTERRADGRSGSPSTKPERF
jgi:hypothetical protein